MSTHPIPAGTVNFPVNMPKPLRAALGRFSTLSGFRSVGSWIRGLLSLEVTGWRRHVQDGAAGIVAHLEPVDVPASVVEEARAAMERAMGPMIAAVKGVAS